MHAAHFVPSKGHLLNDTRKTGILPVNLDACCEPKAAPVCPALGTDRALTHPSCQSPPVPRPPGHCGTIQDALSAGEQGLGTAGDRQASWGHAMPLAGTRTVLENTMSAGLLPWLTFSARENQIPSMDGSLLHNAECPVRIWWCRLKKTPKTRKEFGICCDDLLALACQLYIKKKPIETIQY